MVPTVCVQHRFIETCLYSSLGLNSKIRGTKLKRSLKYVAIYSRSTNSFLSSFRDHSSNQSTFEDRSISSVQQILCE
jgi:hypothetical protein